MPHLALLEGHQVLRQQAMNARPQGAGGNLMLGRGRLHRDHDVALDLDHPARRLRGKVGVELLDRSEIIAVADHKCRVRGIAQRGLHRRRTPRDEADPAPLQV